MRLPVRRYPPNRMGDHYVDVIVGFGHRRGSRMGGWRSAGEGATRNGVSTREGQICAAAAVALPCVVTDAPPGTGLLPG